MKKLLTVVVILAVLLPHVAFGGNWIYSRGNRRIEGNLDVKNGNISWYHRMQESEYVIYEVGSTFYAKNGLTGLIDYSGTSLQTVANNAMGNLTVGRTWKETVQIIGNNEISGPLLPPSFTHLNLSGSIKMADNTNNTDLITLTSVNNVEISGGLWDGNYSNQTGYPDGIEVNASSEIIIRNLEVKNIVRHGVYLVNASHDIDVRNVYSHNTGDDPFTTLTNVYNVTFTNIRASDGRSAVGSSSGIEIEDGSHHITVNGARIEDFPVGTNLYPGGIIITADGSQAVPHDILISNVFIDNVGRNGIQVTSTVADMIYGVNIVNAVVERADNIGIYVAKAKQINIANTIVDGDGGTTSTGIQIVNAETTDIVLDRVDVSESAGHGIWIDEATRCKVLNSYSYNNGQGAQWYAGLRITNTDADDPGYHIIKNNNFTDSQITKTQSFGISFNDTDYNYIYDNVVSGNDSTGMTLNASGSANSIFRGNEGYSLSAKPLVANDTTPSVGGSNSAGRHIFSLPNHTIPTEIMDLDNPVIGSVVTLVGLVCASNCATITDGGNFNLDGAWTQATDASITLYIQGDNDYVEVYRKAP